MTNESRYGVIEFDFNVVYNGTEIMDVFSVGGEMSLAQDSDLWTVEFLSVNGGEYQDTIEVSLGIGDSSTDSLLTTSDLGANHPTESPMHMAPQQRTPHDHANADRFG